MATKRKALSKRMRFEVFKRDQFKCVYCGASAPDVVLHADHVVPHSKGGKDTLLNLVTACSSCNGGKSNIELSDNSAIEKQRKQAEDLQEKREQLQMMAQWIDGLDKLQEDSIDILENHWFKEWPGIAWSRSGRDDMKKLLKKHSVIQITDAMNISKEKYVDDYKSTEQRHLAFTKISGILYMVALSAKEPHLKDAYYCRGILKNRINIMVPDWEVLNMIKSLLAEYETEYVKGMCKTVRNWSDFRDTYNELINQTLNE